MTFGRGRVTFAAPSRRRRLGVSVVTPRIRRPCMTESSTEITHLVAKWSGGDEAALEDLIERIYPDLRAIAHAHLRARRGTHTVSTTALVHEAYIKLAGSKGGVWPSRAHFFAFCSKAMRHLLVDFARRRSTKKRGGRPIHVTLADDSVVIGDQAADLLDVEEALERLEHRSERMARIVECRFFGGMSVKETAEALGTAPRTVEREWARARVYLRHALSDEPG
jgi:RNA polymerase sigma factor (TIGR02999 family)